MDADPPVVQILARSLARRLDFLAGLAAATKGTFELCEAPGAGYMAMMLPRDGAAIVGKGATCSKATLELLREIETKRRK